MEPPSRYSVSPYYSFVTVPPRPVSFAEDLRAIWRWLANRQPKLTLWQRFREARLLSELAEELSERPDEAVSETSLMVPETRSAKPLLKRRIAKTSKVSEGAAGDDSGAFAPPDEKNLSQNKGPENTSGAFAPPGQ